MKVPAIIKPFYSYLCINPYSIKLYFIKDNFNMCKVLFTLTKSDNPFKIYNKFKNISLKKIMKLLFHKKYGV